METSSERRGEEAESAGTGAAFPFVLCVNDRARVWSGMVPFQRGYKRGMEATREQEEENQKRPARELHTRQPNQRRQATTGRYKQSSAASVLPPCTPHVHSHTPSLAPFLLALSCLGSGSGRSSRRCRCELNFLLGGRFLPPTVGPRLFGFAERRRRRPEGQTDIDMQAKEK